MTILLITRDAKLLIPVDIRKRFDLERDCCSHHLTAMSRLALQSRKDVQDMVSARTSGLQCELDGNQHGLQTVNGSGREDLDHYPVAASLFQQMSL
jgi:hypothetical protein